jgi:hypothetical protein
MLEVQLAFVWDELETGDGPANPLALYHLRRVVGANRRAVNAATTTFMNDFENPFNKHGEANLPIRKQEAWNVFLRFG